MTPTDPDPAATELAPPQTRAECVAWLRARATILLAKAELYTVAGDSISHEWCIVQRCGLMKAADDLAAGEQP